MTNTTKRNSFSNLLRLLCLYIVIGISASQADIYLQSEEFTSYFHSRLFYSREFCCMTVNNSDECSTKIREVITSQKTPDMLVIIPIGSSASIFYKNGEKEIDRTINLKVDADTEWLAGHLYTSNLTLVAHLQDNSAIPDGFLEIKPYFEAGSRASLVALFATRYISLAFSIIQNIRENLQMGAQNVMSMMFIFLYPSAETRQQERILDELK